MWHLIRLDPNRAGKQAEDLQKKLRGHEIAKLIGSPPGYQLYLFDEIERASDALWDLLLEVLDKASLTLGDNRRVDFSRAMIFMTSNLGASEMNDLMVPKLGFHDKSD
jgi:ATP-dependent Clp protease ATP-binding subunit ClpB